MLPITITSTTHIRSFVKGCHVQKHLWKPVVQDHLMTKIEPRNPLEKYAVSTKKWLNHRKLVVWQKRKVFKYFFNFLRSDRFAMWAVATAEKGGILLMKMVCTFYRRCTLNITEKRVLVEMVKQEIYKHKLSKDLLLN